MTPTGYTLSYRSKWEHPVFKSKQEAAVWAWMCDVAQWKDTRIGTKFGPVEMRRGELIIAERSLAEDFGMHRNTLRSLLQRMADDGMISLFKDRCPHRAGTVVKIENYERYQVLDGVANDAQDRKPTEDRTEAGPKEDRSRTKNNTVNTDNTKKESREGKPSLGESAPPDPELFDGVEVVDAEVIAEPAEADPKVVRIADRQALLDKQFAEFWAAYPHKVGKQAAVKCYAKARKTASHDTIMHGLANALPAFSRCSETRFIPHPKTWLNEGRWDDVITTNGSSNYGRSGFNDRAERNGFLSLDRTIESCSV